MTRGDWNDDNARGLAFASVGAWSDAADAFSDAVRAVESVESVAAHEALALVLNNLAHACFRAQRVDEGIQYAQRACSLRVALVGEDALTVARARADLAVMLGSAGRSPEALQLIDRAIASIDRHVGDEDLRLASVLENAARLSMAAAQPGSAEPYLLRLHALLASHDLATDSADTLLQRVSHFRVQPTPTRRDTPTPLTPVRGADLVSIAAEPPHAATNPETESFAPDAVDSDDDEFLREAVALTDSLLRSTPSHAPVVAVEEPVEAEPVDVEVPVELASDQATIEEITFIDAIDSVPTVDAEPLAATAFELSMVELAPIDDIALELTVGDSRISPDDIFGDTTLDLIDDPLAAASAFTPPTATPHVAKHAPTPLGRADVLGFQIEYGTPSGEALDALASSIVAPPTSVRVQTPTDDSMSFAIMPPAPLATVIATPQVNAATATPPAPAIAPIPRGLPTVVMPSPARAQRAIDATNESVEKASRLSVQNSDDVSRDRNKKLRAGRASTPRSQTGLLIAAGITATATAVAIWMAIGPR